MLPDHLVYPSDLQEIASHELVKAVCTIYFFKFFFYCASGFRKSSFYFDHFYYPVEGVRVAVHGYLHSLVLADIFDYVVEVRNGDRWTLYPFSREQYFLK